MGTEREHRIGQAAEADRPRRPHRDPAETQPRGSGQAMPAGYWSAYGMAPVQRKQLGGVAVPAGYLEHHGVGTQVSLSQDLRPQESDSAPRGAGVALPLPLQERMGRALGADFSSVRVHEGAYVQEAGARAWTRGHELHFAPGQYDPESQSGQELIGHELTHVVQQAEGRVTPTLQGKGMAINDDPALEHEADVRGAMAARGEPACSPGEARRGGGGAAAQRKLAVAILTDDAGVLPSAVKITDVQIAGRPHHVSFAQQGGGQSEGDHSTAWSVMRIGVHNRLHGKTLDQAVTAMDALLDEAIALPGAQATRVNAMGTSAGERGKFCADALVEANAAKAAAANAILGGSVPAVHAALQSYIGLYLKYRNAIGLSVMHLGRPARGDGEANPLKLLQYWEQRWTDAEVPDAGEQDDLLNALGVLFSGKAKEEVRKGDNRLPGVKNAHESKASILAALVSQHDASLRSSFPNIMERLAPTKVALSGAMGSEWAGTLPDGAKAISTGAAFAVQLELTPGNQIAKVVTSGRPKHATTGGLEGDHTSAYVLSARAIELALIGRTLVQACAALDTVEQEFRAMPGAEDARTDRMTDERQAHFTAADAELTAAAAAATLNATMSTIQRYAGALLYFRNSIGLAVVGAETDSRGKGEAAKLGRLEAIEAVLRDTANKVDFSEVCGAIEGLFDGGAFARYADATVHNQGLVETFNIETVIVGSDEEDVEDVSDLEALSSQDVLHEYSEDEQEAHSRRDPYPGYIPGESLEEVVAALITQHLTSIKLVAPLVFAVITEQLLSRVVCSLANDVDVDGTAVVAEVKGMLTGTEAARLKRVPKKTTREERGGKKARERDSKRARGTTDEAYVP